MNERPELPPRREGGLRRLSPSVHWAQSFRAYKNKVVNRSIYDFELLYIQEGQCTVRVGSHAPYELAAGQLFYLPSRVRHSIVVTSERIDYVAVHFDYFDEFAAWDMPSLAVDDANVLPERFCAEPDVGQETYLFTHLVPEPAAVALLQRIVEEFTARSPWYETACKALVMQLLVQLLRVRPAARRYERYREAVLELMADIRGRSGDDWTVGSMASRINVHEDYFSKMFTDIAGVNPSKFVQQARHREAKRLLRDTDWKMDRIARRVGYADLHYFSRMFRKLEGIPVREYRKLAQRYRPV